VPLERVEREVVETGEVVENAASSGGHAWTVTKLHGSAHIGQRLGTHTDNAAGAHSTFNGRGPSRSPSA
jgi:hypothetical protein